MAKALRTTTTLLVAVFLSSFLSSCGGKDTHEKIKKDTLSLVEKMVSIVEEAKDKESAQEAAKKLEALIPKFEKLMERSKKIGDPDAETEKKIQEEFDTRGNELQKKMQAAILALGKKDAEAVGILMEPFEKIGKMMMDAMGEAL